MRILDQDLLTTLRKSGLRLTPQRIEIYRFLADSHIHPTAQQVYQAIKADFPSLSRATVYNNLEAMVKLGCINALGAIGDDTTHYDANVTPHINLACISCHQIIDIPSDHIQQVMNEVGRDSGYKIIGARVLYYGICSTCQSR